MPQAQAAAQITDDATSNGNARRIAGIRMESFPSKVLLKEKTPFMHSPRAEMCAKGGVQGSTEYLLGEEVEVVFPDGHGVAAGHGVPGVFYFFVEECFVEGVGGDADGCVGVAFADP